MPSGSASGREHTVVQNEPRLEVGRAPLDSCRWVPVGRGGRTIRPDEAEAAKSAREASRFGLTGWKVQPELPTLGNFEATTVFITEDDMREMFGCGPDVSKHVAVAQQFADAG
jgi:hypothetical protein